MKLPILISTCSACAAVVTSTINNVGKKLFFSQLRSTKASSAHSKCAREKKMREREKK